jgi:hypothetical protein
MNFRGPQALSDNLRNYPIFLIRGSPIMSKAIIFTIFIIVELAIISACVWAAFHHVPVRRYLFPAIALFSLSGLWLVWATLRNTPK